MFNLGYSEWAEYNAPVDGLFWRQVKVKNSFKKRDRCRLF